MTHLAIVNHCSMSNQGTRNNLSCRGHRHCQAFAAETRDTCPHLKSVQDPTPPHTVSQLLPGFCSNPCSFAFCLQLTVW